MTETSVRIPILVWSGWLLLSLFLQTGPESLRDLLQSGQQASSAFTLEWAHILFRGSVEGPEHPQVAGDSSDSEQLRAENRALAHRIAELQAENLQLQRSAPLLQHGEERPLVGFNAVSAMAIGQRGDVLSESLQLLISLGQEQGIVAGELVLSGNGLLIDQGAAQGLSPDQLLIAGRGLYGRTVQVGRQTSLVQPITDPKFRMAVRVVRRSPLGAIQGPQGILAGTGTGCRLDEVAATEAVATGDEVYTDRLVSPGAEPIYCGRVTKADAGPGDNHWTINVDPLHSASSLPAQLFVLRAELSPERLSEILPKSVHE